VTGVRLVVGVGDSSYFAARWNGDGMNRRWYSLGVILREAGCKTGLTVGDY